MAECVCSRYRIHQVQLIADVLRDTCPYPPAALLLSVTPSPAALPRPIALGKLSPPFTYPMVFKASFRLCAAAAALLLIKFIPALVALLDAQQLLTGVLAPYLPDRIGQRW